MEIGGLSTRHWSCYRPSLIPGLVIPTTWKTVLVTCSASCLAFMGGCKGMFQPQWCHWLARTQHSPK